MKYSIMLLFPVLLILASCIPDPLDVEGIPTVPARIVVSTQVIPGQSIAVLLTKSIGALDAGDDSNAQALLDQIVIEDALVTLSYNGLKDTLTMLSAGIYGSANTPLIAGTEYHLEVNSATLGKVEAFTEMKQEVVFDDVSATLHISGRDTLARVDYTFTDLPGKNWYMIAVQRIRRSNDLSENLNPRIFIKALADDEFGNQQKSEEFTVPFRRFSAGDTVSVVLANISESYYTYLKETVDTRNNISSFVSDPINLPTNVENGYGYFNMHVPDIHLFTMN